MAVPCSTSNLGPGFDQLGLCLSLFLHVEVGPRPAGQPQVVAHSSPSGPSSSGPEPSPDWPEPGRDLLLRAFERSAGPRAQEAQLIVDSEIPIGRGLGSTGAAVAAGLLLGRAWCGELEPDRRGLLNAGIELEGHPDNVTASLFGGCTVCVPIAGEPAPLIQVDVHPDLGFAAAWPREPLATARARAVLPDRVPFADAVENARRVPLLLEGLRTGNPALLRHGTSDLLHEPYRLGLLPGASRALDAARQAGAFAANISGAGSALVAIGPPARRDEIARAMADELRAATGWAAGRPLDVVRAAPVVERT
ncbi:homoserine kinase [Engelhardtia mirabilis]|uniref:homoserine kinase n=1 Tax=Engelhardtia mirabilis TaxID=2528011 RepID=UPI003AF3B5E0